MPAKRLHHMFLAAAIALSLAALPMTVTLDGLGGQDAFAKNNGNAGNGGAGKSGGHGASGKHGAAGGAGATGKSAGQSAATGDTPSAQAPGQLKKDAVLAAASADEAGAAPSPSEFGRLNGFMHAAPQALDNAASNSAIGVVANAYREALSAYAAGAGEDEGDGTTPDPNLEAAARALALAANKELTADVVAAVNARLAGVYRDDPALAGLSDPDAEFSQDLAEDIATLAQQYQDLEASQGLGSDSDESGGDEVADANSGGEANSGDSLPE